ncbi:MAG TPA: hypothetical protein VFX31_10745, partial [Ktedonobacterales bacterium]|nr:hypothetical protein [Ktedonobacterales bacterium]
MIPHESNGVIHRSEVGRFSMASTSFSLARSGRRRVTIPALVTFLGIASLLVSACNSGGGSSATKHTLTAICSVGGSYTENMSPFSPNVN